MGDANSYSPSISEDGRYVVFVSWALNLVGGDYNGRRDIFIHDHRTGPTERIMNRPLGQEPNAETYDAVIAGNGRNVVFRSDASNMVKDDTNRVSDIFMYDIRLKQVRRINKDGQMEADNWSMYVSVNYDGSVIAFTSAATNLSPLDTNNTLDLFVKIKNIYFIGRSVYREFPVRNK